MTNHTLTAAERAYDLEFMGGRIQKHLAAGDFPAALKAVVVAASLVDDVERATVAAARAHGASWSEVGAALGISKQAAWLRFGKPTGEQTPE